MPQKPRFQPCPYGAREGRTLGTRFLGLVWCSGRKNVLRKLLRILYRRLKEGFPVCWLCSTVNLFVCHWESSDQDWMKCTRVNVCSSKSFLCLCGFCFSPLENYFGLGQPMLKEKRIIPSVWGGIKSFEHFQRDEYFSGCSFDLFVSWFRLLSPGWIKTRFFKN